MYNLTLCMIVKNEAHCITETLNTLVNYIDYWVICDTGSTDKTESVVKKFFAKHNIRGEYRHHKWVNFAHNRTLAFAVAYKKARYVLVFDADDLLVVNGNTNVTNNNNNNISTFFPPDLTKGVECYNLPMRSGHDDSRRNFIFRNDIKWQYRGVVHEQAYRLDKHPFQITKVEGGDFYVESRRLGSRNLNPNKYLDDAKVMITAVNEILADSRHPDRDLLLRYYNFIGQSFYDHKDYANAIKYYKLRMVDNSEESYCACLQIGLCMQELAHPESEIVDNYKLGYKMVPERAEILYSLGLYYININKLKEAFVTFSLANTIPFPVHATLHVNKAIYDVGIRYQLALVANLLAKFDISTAVCQQVLDRFGGDSGSSGSSSVASITATTTASTASRYQQIVKELYMVMDANKRGVRQRRKYVFNNYKFYEGVTIGGYDLELGNKVSSGVNNYLAKLKALADTTEDCLAFTTDGQFKNAIINTNALLDIDDDDSASNSMSSRAKASSTALGCYIKLGWKDDSKPNLAVYVGKQPLRRLSDCTLVETLTAYDTAILTLATELKVHYNVFVIDDSQTDKVMIKYNGVFFTTLDYYNKQSTVITTSAVIVCRDYVNYFFDETIVTGNVTSNSDSSCHKNNNTYLWITSYHDIMSDVSVSNGSSSSSSSSSDDYNSMLALLYKRVAGVVVSYQPEQNVNIDPQYVVNHIPVVGDTISSSLWHDILLQQ